MSHDYAILSNIQSVELAESCRNVLSDLFSIVKDLDQYIRFVFITGVSKFSKTSIFSGLNNLEDLTISAQGATLLGYTQEDLVGNFKPYIKKISAQNKTTFEKLIEQVRLWYDGYQF